MASIKQALKQRTSYTTKHGLTIPYNELRKMKRLNDQLYYYKKQLNVEVGERIKIGSLANDTTAKIRSVEASINIGKYMRIKRRVDKSPSAKLERKLKRLERLIRKQINHGTKHDVELPITEKDIISFMEAKEKINIDKIINFKDNLIQTINENFTGILSKEQINALEDTINNLSAYETHRLAMDNEGLLDYIYYDYDTVSRKVKDLFDAIKGVSSDASQEALNELHDDIQNTLFNMGLTDTQTRHTGQTRP
jgi:hypothetical protein